MQQGNYLNELLCACAPDNGFAQDAIEHAILSGQIVLTFNREDDERAIGSAYDSICNAYRTVLTPCFSGVVQSIAA